MTFEEALVFASEGDLEKAVQFFAPDENPSTRLVLKHEEQVEFYTSEGMPTTSLRREFVLTYDGVTLVSWWEDYEGYYGSGFTGWWIDEIDADGPPKGLEALLAEVGLAIPDLEVPRPPIPDQAEEE
jgi:hypothetical protein